MVFVYVAYTVWTGVIDATVVPSTTIPLPTFGNATRPNLSVVTRLLSTQITPKKNGPKLSCAHSLPSYPAVSGVAPYPRSSCV